MNKPLAVWGTGDKGALFSTIYNKEEIRFYIDNDISKEGGTFFGRKVIHPSNVENWEEVFIVIAIEDYEGVKRHLMKLGLREGRDFIHFQRLIGRDDILGALEQEIDGFAERIEADGGLKKYKALIFGAMASFDPNGITNLNRLYAYFGENSFILMSETMLIRQQYEEAQVKFPFCILPTMMLKNFYIPDVGQWEIRQDKNKEKHIEKKEYLIRAAKIMESAKRDLKPGYAQVAVYYYDYVIGKILDGLRPRLVFMWNQFYPFHLVLDMKCRERNIQTVYMEHGVLPGTYVVERQGQMGESLAAINPKAFMQMPISNDDYENARHVWAYLYESRLNRKKQASLDFGIIKDRVKNGRPIILYAGQNDFESGLFPYTEKSRRFHSPAFEGSMDALRFLSELAVKNGWNIIYKPHPFCKALREGTPENVILVNDGDINDLIDLSDVTVTILSTVGYVSLIRRKATVMLGYTQLRGKGCTYEAFAREDVEAKINAALKRGLADMQRENFTKHIAQLLKYYLYDNGGSQGMHFGMDLERIREILP